MLKGMLIGAAGAALAVSPCRAGESQVSTAPAVSSPTAPAPMPHVFDPQDVDGDVLFLQDDFGPYAAALQVDESTAAAREKAEAWRRLARDDHKFVRLAGRRAGEWERFSQGMASIPAGEFEMGSPDGQGEPDEHPRHKVFLDAYAIDRYPVTVAQYRKFAQATARPMHERPPWNGDDHPVVYVSWHDALAYCLWAGKRLPTEAEWEKAARGGSATKYSFGDDEGRIGDYAWYIENSSGTTHPVGTKKPNPYGLYDMIGNVYEWVADRYGEDYYRKSPLRNPLGPAAGRARVLRGGAWGITAYYCRAANRYSSAPQVGYDLRGLRCASR